MDKIKNTWVRGNTPSHKKEEANDENGKIIYESGWKKGIYQSKKNNIKDELKNLHNAFKVKMGWKNDNSEIIKNIQSPIQKSNAKVQESVDLNRETRKMLGELEITNESQLDFQPYSNITTQTKHNPNLGAMNIADFDEEEKLFTTTALDQQLNESPAVKIISQEKIESHSESNKLTSLENSYRMSAFNADKKIEDSDIKKFISTAKNIINLSFENLTFEDLLDFQKEYEEIKNVIPSDTLKGFDAEIEKLILYKDDNFQYTPKYINKKIDI
jgi:hypothetical protein